MGSVLIKGMDMPKGCFYDEPPYHCPFYDRLKCIRLNTYVPEKLYMYLPNCPLVEVPPHGRLIDADRMAQTHKSGSFDIAKVIKNAPTVIEAEE